jgi:hypothetical protein
LINAVSDQKTTWTVTFHTGRWNQLTAKTRMRKFR